MEKKYKIHEVAERLGVSPSLIRYYEEKGLVTIAKDPENGYRLFSEADVFKLWLITFHRAMDMGLGEIDFLIRGTSLDETQTSVRAHREKTLRILEQANRDLILCDFYDRYIERARREGDAPLRVEEKTFYLYDIEDAFRRQKPSFPACTVGSSFENGEERQFSVVYEEDMYILTKEDQERYKEKLVLKDMFSVVVSVDKDSFGRDALKKAIAAAECGGVAVCEPCYAFYQLSLCDHDDIGYSYEVFMTEKKGS